MDISSDSSDTIILLSNNDEEPSDSEVENILRKYSSTSSGDKFEESTNLQNNLYSTEKSVEKFADILMHKTMEKNHDGNYTKKSSNQISDYSCDKYNDNLEDYSGDNAVNGEFSDEDLLEIPLIKRLKKDGGDNIKKSTNEMCDYKSHPKNYRLEDYSNDSDENLKNGYQKFSELISESKNVNTDYLDMDSEEILRELNNKYHPSTSKSDYQKQDLVVLSDDSDTNELNHDSFPPSFDTFSDNIIGKLAERKKVEDGSINRNIKYLSENESDTEIDKLSPKTAAKLEKQRDLEKRRREKEKKREEAEKKKTMRNMEKERKKEEMERQKALKNALKTVEQSTKPDECIKHMIVELALEILQKDYGEILTSTLKSNDISFKFTPQMLPNLISWCRKLQTIENMLLKSTEVNEKHFLLIMDKSEFMGNIRKNSLSAHIQKISSLIKFKMLTIAVLGIDKVTADQDIAVMEAQLLFKCYFRFLKQANDLAILVLELTKAIAQIPYKAKKEEKYKLQTEYFNDSNKDTVRVDKNGNGLGRLWQQMLTMFPLARLETAEAITAAYPTPDSLFKAYNECQSRKEELLQDLPIRRALGPCVSIRKIGPELSRKCSTFFYSTDNVLL